MKTTVQVSRRWTSTLQQAWFGLRLWGVRRWMIAALATLGIGLLIGVATVLVPNSFFARDVPVIWWNYPVWLLTSGLSGMLLASYVGLDSPGGGGAPKSGRESRMGVAGALLGWFAVGCPVCNKIALLMLGFSGAMTWFAPLQPIMALGALLLSALALVLRLGFATSCPVSNTSTENSLKVVR